MSFFIISEGMSQIEEIFCGATKEDTVTAARAMINQWPEYAEMTDEEIIDMTQNHICEFDLVEIPEDLPADKSKTNLIKIYNHYCSGIVPRPAR